MSEQFECHKCPFHDPLITNDFQCEKSNMVTRRGGPDIACLDLDASTRCQSIFEALKRPVLESQDLEDDLTQIPSSLLKKIQFAGMIALDKLTGGNEEIQNLHALSNTVINQFPDLSLLPGSELAAQINSFQIRRRRKK